MWFMTSVSFIISLFSFCLDNLSTGESWGGLMCNLSFSNVSFTNVGALAFEAQMLRNEMSSWWIFPLMKMKCPSPSLLLISVLSPFC